MCTVRNDEDWKEISRSLPCLSERLRKHPSCPLSLEKSIGAVLSTDLRKSSAGEAEMNNTETCTIKLSFKLNV